VKQLYYYENFHTLDEEQLLLIKIIESHTFPYFFNQTTTHNFHQFAHTLMERDELNRPITGKINSELFKKFADLFLDICSKNQISVNCILRAAINCTYHYPDKLGEVHIDHDGFDHYNFVMYLNNFDNGSTYIFDELGNNFLKEAIADKNKFIIFNGLPHAQGFCAPGQLRRTLVFTFY